MHDSPHNGGDTNEYPAVQRDDRPLVDPKYETGELHLPESSKTVPQSTSHQEEEDDSPPWSIILESISDDPQIFGADVRGLTVIGRSDPNSNEQPDLDLAPHGAFDHGVSRRHAVFMPTRQGLTLLDLDSTNGTWINGLSLESGQRYRVRIGDVLEFGTLKLRVRLVGAMPTDQDSDSTMITRRRPKNE